MTDFSIEVTHACGHTQRHTGQSASGDTTFIGTHLASRKCGTCRPTCEFCHRVGDREDMLITDDGHSYCNAWCRVQALHPTHYREHNKIAIPGFLKDWEDVSYHNDLCGRSELDIGPDYITVWVDFEKVEDREAPECTRFVVEFCDDNRSAGDGDVLYSGDDVTVAALWARAAESAASGEPVDDDIAAMVAQIQKLIA